jgi:hypothetical protein
MPRIIVTCHAFQFGAILHNKKYIYTGQTGSQKELKTSTQVFDSNLYQMIYNPGKIILVPPYQKISVDGVPLRILKATGNK